MAFEAATAIVRFVADPSKLKGAVGSINGILDKFKQRAEAAARAARRILLVGTAVAAGVIALAAQQANAEAKLEAVIRATGQAAGFTAEQLFEQAAALQELTATGDEVIINAQAILATFKQIRGDIFQDAIEAALDMSAVLDQDLKSSVIGLGKALNDPIVGITALSRVGVSFTKEQKDLIRVLQESGDVMGAQRVILDELKGEFGGAAKALGETFAGQISKLKNSLGDLGEEIGQTLVPSLTLFVEKIKVIIPTISDWVKENGRGIISIGAMTTAVLGLITIIPGLIAAFNLLILNPVGLVITGVTIALIAVGQAMRDSSVEGNIFTDVLTVLANKLGLVSAELRKLLDPKTPFLQAEKDFRNFQKTLRKKFPELGPFATTISVDQILGLDDATAAERLKILTEFQQKLERLVAETKKLEEREGGAGVFFAQKFLGGDRGVAKLRALRKALAEEIKALNKDIDEAARARADEASNKLALEVEQKKVLIRLAKQQRDDETLFFKAAEAARREEMQQIKDRNKLLREIELIGIDEEARQKILTRRRREDIIDRAQKAGLSKEQLDELKTRLFFQELRDAQGPKRDARPTPPQFVGLTDLFKRIQGARNPELEVAREVKDLNEKQVEILKQMDKNNRELLIKIADKLGVSTRELRTVFGKRVGS